MAYYIKVTKDVSDYLQLTSERNRTADGNYLLWQADVARFPGATIFDRARHIGGVALTPQAARQETDGVGNPVEVRNPDWLDTPSANGETDKTGKEDTL